MAGLPKYWYQNTMLWSDPTIIIHQSSKPRQWCYCQFFLMTLFWKRRETIPLVEMKVKMKVAISKQQLHSTNNNAYEWKICWMLWIVMAEKHGQLKSILMSLFTFQRVWVVNSFTKAHKMVSKCAKNVVVFYNRLRWQAGNLKWKNSEKNKFFTFNTLFFTQNLWLIFIELR